jgi:hypothetical protein
LHRHPCGWGFKNKNFEKINSNKKGAMTHICGVLTSQPDEDCYKNPNRAKEATVASEGQDTVAEGVDTVGCIKCGKRFNHLTELWKHLDECAEAPSDGQP